MENLPPELLAEICGQLPTADAWRLRRVSRAWSGRAMDAIMYRLRHGKDAPFRLMLSVNYLHLTQTSYVSNYEEFPVDLHLREYDTRTGVLEFGSSTTKGASVLFDMERFGSLQNTIRGTIQWCDTADAGSPNKDNFVSLSSPRSFPDGDDYRRASKVDTSFTFGRLAPRRVSTASSASDAYTGVTIVAEEQKSPESAPQHLLSYHCDLKYSMHTDTQRNTLELRIHHFRISEAGLFALISPGSKHLIPQLRGLFPAERVRSVLDAADRASITWRDEWFDHDVVLSWLSGSDSTRTTDELDKVVWKVAAENLNVLFQEHSPRIRDNYADLPLFNSMWFVIGM